MVRKLPQYLVRLATYVALYEAYWLVKLLPCFTYALISRVLGDVGYYTMRVSRRRVLTNFHIAFGTSLTIEEKKRVCRRLFAQIVLNALELIALTKISRGDLEDFVDVKGEENLRKAVQSGCGVVAVCAHLGNFPAMQIRLLKMGYPMNVIIRNASSVYLNRLWEKMMRQASMRYILKANLRRAIESSQDRLKNGDVLCLYLDQHAGNGVSVPFFGRDVLVPVGAAVLARKYQCEVVGLFCFRKPGGRHQVVIEGPYPLRRSKDAPADTRANTAFFMQRVEHHVREHPEQWFSWLHRRFR